MRFIYAIILIFAFSACSHKENMEKLNIGCELQFLIHGRYGEDRFGAYFNETSESKDTLYILQTVYNKGVESSFTNKIKLKSMEKDILYSHFQKIKENFKLEDNNVVLDGTTVRVTIIKDGKSVVYVYKGLTSASSADPEIGELIRFFNKKLPDSHQIH